VAFSRQDIFRIREAIERLTDHKCCVVFGQLPPETRSKQASLFNEEGSGYDVLVASDAVGMGLNLNIRRIVFHATEKIGDVVANGKQKVEASMMKQIAGRAGRRSSQYKDQGMVTCLHAADMPWLHESLGLPVKQVEAAGLFPAVEHLQVYSNLLDRLDAEASRDAARERKRKASASSSANGNDDGDSDDDGDDHTWGAYPASPPSPSSLTGLLGKAPPSDGYQKPAAVIPNKSGKRLLSDTLGSFFSSASCAKGGLYFVTKHDEVPPAPTRGVETRKCAGAQCKVGAATC
jgi:hypothetical protein